VRSTETRHESGRRRSDDNLAAVNRRAHLVASPDAVEDSGDGDRLYAFRVRAAPRARLRRRVDENPATPRSASAITSDGAPAASRGPRPRQPHEGVTGLVAFEMEEERVGRDRRRSHPALQRCVWRAIRTLSASRRKHAPHAPTASRAEVGVWSSVCQLAPRCSTSRGISPCARKTGRRRRSAPTRFEPKRSVREIGAGAGRKRLDRAHRDSGSVAVAVREGPRTLADVADSARYPSRARRRSARRLRLHASEALPADSH